MNYTCLHCHSYYSLLDGLSTPEDIAKRTVQIGNTAGALTDHGNISGAIAFMQAMKDKGLKPILGCELYISTDSKTRPQSHLPVLAKNDKGWNQLVQATSYASKPENFYYKPRLSLEELGNYTGDLIGFSGHLGSDISNAIQKGENVDDVAYQLQDLFGKGNFFLEVQLMDAKNSPEQLHVANEVRKCSQRTGIPTIATVDAHYARQEQSTDHQVLLCANMHVTMDQGKNPKFLLNTFFKSNNYHIPSYDEMIAYGYTPEELARTNEVADMVSEYKNILKSPILPKVECPPGFDVDTYLRHLCDEGLKNKGLDKSEYIERLGREDKVIQEANLSGYFLVVVDILNFVRSKGWLPGPGRGSAAGSLISYLVRITGIDPLKYGLIFERFYNVGRNTVDHISMPDIDIDVPAGCRDEIIQYLRDKYGEDKVAQIVTFQTMMGKKALKSVFTAYGDMSFDEMNRATKYIVDKSKIAGELKEMKEELGYSSVIRWALINRPEKFEEWCVIDDDGNLTGPLSDRFAQAIRLEGTKCAQSKHAAGIVIGPEPLDQLCPMIYDSKTGLEIIGLEMEDAEAVGLVKLDILGLSTLDKIQDTVFALAESSIDEL